jgi:hypothetical protein
MVGPFCVAVTLLAPQHPVSHGAPVNPFPGSTAVFAHLAPH